VENIDICGKTVLKNFTKIERKKSTAKDHSIFVAFAPMENPKNSDAILVKMVDLVLLLDLLPV
jgi:penicillin-binding protein 2